MIRSKKCNLIFFLMVLLFAFSAWADPKIGATRDDVSQPVYDFKIETAWLLMKDGVKLSTTLYKPDPRSPGEKFPVIFEFLPYRKDDGGYIGTYSLYTYFVRRGYIMVRADIRGTGSSEGIFPLREYSEQELDDAVDIIGQLSAMPGSNGNVGMWGISWGGFNAIQVAMRRPPALKAILAAMATDDLYHDDIHYIDGAFHVDEWAFWFDHSKAIPRSPDYPLDEAYFKERFDSYPGLLTYLKQQKDGEFWRRNSLRWQYDKINIPCYLIGGLLDGYRDSIPRMLENMKVPIKAEVGPWNHAWPDDGTPGPNYEWRHEAVRWWDQWLKGKNTGVLDDPRFTVFLREGHGPDASLAMTPGQWITEEWPIPGTAWKMFYPAKDHELRTEPSQQASESLCYIPTYGVNTGLWWGEPTDDMRPDDAGSLVFDSARIDKAFEIVGFPQVRLRVLPDAPLADWTARLEDVFPDGRVSLVTGALINGSQWRSRLDPQPLTPGETYDLEFEMHFTTWTFQPGHRLRLSVTNSLFPMIWPTPYLMTPKLFIGIENSRVELPVIPAKQRRKPSFLPPEKREVRADARDLGSEVWPQGTYEWKRDLWRGIVSVEWQGKSSFEIQGRRYHSTEKNYYETNEKAPAQSRFLGEDSDRIELPGRNIYLLTNVELRSDEKNFYITFVRQIFENDQLIRRRQWEEAIPRMFN
jgi:putative CocE/NonD family hydrolase